MTKRFLSALLAACIFAGPTLAALEPGSPAPDFATPATLGGKEFTFKLADALKSGPVVLYFYPAAFTPGCTVEAHDFAEAMPQFKALGATVIGVSRDGIEKLNRFSVEECRSAFPVASDPSGSITRGYDAVLSSVLALSDRTSYVIAPEGTIVYAYHALDPDGHVTNTLGALQAWRQAHPQEAP